MFCCPGCGTCLKECSCIDCCRGKPSSKKHRSSVTEAEEALEKVECLEKRPVFSEDPRFLPLTFVPNIVVKEILSDSMRVIPYQIQTDAVILIADVCGFTSLTETYCQKGTSGIEELARILNGYMSTLAAMLLNADGDILNFAGDAFLVYWEDSEEAVEKAYNCAVDLQTHPSLQEKNLGGTLQVKVGIGKGPVVTWILGSPQDFLLFVSAGHGIVIAHQAEEMCSSGDIIVTQSVFETLETVKAKTFTTTELLDGFVKLQTDEELSYISELTMVTILFISLKNINVEEPLILDKTFDIVLACAKLQGGDVLYLSRQASVGVATGTCYCGIVGHPQRQEYTVIGNRVNLAARIMVKYQEEPIVLDSTTYNLSRQSLGDACFYQLPGKKMKGIESAGRIYAYRIRSQKICSCCTIEDSRSDPFLTIGLLLQRILEMSQWETAFEREQKILKALPLGFDPQLFLLNHLFHVQFPTPEFVNTDEDFMRNEIIRLLKLLFRQFVEESLLLIAIDNADSMDECSWLLLRNLAEEGQFVLICSIAEDYREPSISASLILLKAHTRIKIEDSSDIYYGSLICWFLGVKAVHKELYHYLQEKTSGKTQLLQEVLLSPSVTEFTNLIPFENLDEEKENKFFVSEFPIPKLQSIKTILACDKKEGVDLRKMKITPDVNDAVKQSFNYLTVQDRLLLKRAAILGSVFDQHILEVVSHGVTTKQVCESLNHLLQKNILCFACTSGVILEKLPPQDPFKHLECYNVCFCSKVSAKSPFRNSRVHHSHAGPYSRLMFRTKIFRLCILSFMTKEQYDNMRRDIINELEAKGLNCITCKIKREESVQMEFAMGDMRCAPLQMDMKQCACLEKRPKIYQRLAYIHASHGNKIQSIYFTKKRAQASNTIGYPVQALIYALQAEGMFPEGPANTMEITEEEDATIDVVALRASIKRTMAKSALLLGNYYYAAFYIQRALAMLDMETVYFYGVFSPREFKEILEGYPLLQAESITATIGVLSQTYVSAGKYELAKKILKTEFVALSYYPIDFVQILQFMISLYQCQRLTKPQRKFKRLESNLIGICRQRLQKYDVTLNSIDIRHIGIAYIMVIEMNINRGLLTRAEELAEEAMKFLEYINDQKTMPKIYINLIKIYMHHNRYMDCFRILENLKPHVKSLNSEIWALYYCALLTVMTYKFKGVAEVSDEDKTIVYDCNEFVCCWLKHWALLFSVDLAFYISAVLAVWCLKVVKRVEWSDAHLYFERCYNLATLLSDKLRTDSYWSVAASFIYNRIQLSLENRYANALKFVATRNAILSRIYKMKKAIKIHFPVYLKKYEMAIHDISFLNPDEMLDSF
ncbi:Adenylate cyclase type 10 like protein [Argiope bruennichi]|uniref:Adenylate cyclase type 10 like protein n=1 Tax=Argiope bruennichi TaxID=94029 RepID=A0A8T0EMU5_ARGBR|nr:Adenylate cyclase type 10 like protein [Argiope bruennichi]